MVVLLKQNCWRSILLFAYVCIPTFGSCQFLVVHYFGNDDVLDPVMNESRFGNIKPDGQDVAPGEEYFAYATKP